MTSQTNGSVTECTFKVRSQEVDAQQQLKLSALIMLMQEASMQNVIDLKVSVWDLQDEQTSWVILRKEITIIKMPQLGDVIVIKTYPGGFNRVLALRDYLVYNNAGELLATAASTWTLMNLVTRKIQRIPDHYNEMTYHGDKLPAPASKLKISPEVDDAYNHVVRMGDIDWNRHVNNVVLSKLMLQSAPLEFLQNASINKFTFHIKSECLLGEEITITSTTVDKTTHHLVKAQADDRIIAMAVCEWDLGAGE